MLFFIIISKFIFLKMNFKFLFIWLCIILGFLSRGDLSFNEFWGLVKNDMGNLVGSFIWDNDFNYNKK